MIFRSIAKFISYKRGRADCAVVYLLTEFVVPEVQEVREGVWTALHFGPGQSTFGKMDKLLANTISVRSNVLQDSESQHL